MWPIAMSTFKEVYRKRIVHVIGILTLIYWGLLGFVVYMQPRAFGGGVSLISALVNMSSVITILGFYLSSMLLAFLTVMLSVGVISSEVEDGTVLTLLTKPIPRSSYVLGKYIGVSMMVLAYGLILFLALMLLAAIGKQNFLTIFGGLTLFKGFLLFVLEPLCIAAVAVVGSTLFKTVNNGIFVIALYMLSMIGGIIEQIGSLTSNVDMNTFGIVAGLFAPFEVIYRKMISVIFASVGGYEVLMGFGAGAPGLGGSTVPSNAMMVYVFVYMALALLWAVRRMNKRDIS